MRCLLAIGIELCEIERTTPVFSFSAVIFVPEDIGVRRDNKNVFRKCSLGNMNTAPAFIAAGVRESIRVYSMKGVLIMTTENTKFDDTLYKEPYYTLDGCLYEEVIRNGKAIMVKLCDYLPVLRSEITYDDGTDRKKVFEVSAEHASGVTLPTVKVTADDMLSMKWLLEKWGALGSYSPAGNAAGHIRHAITMTKAEISFRTIYSQTGWREINGEWFFLMPQEDSPLTVELKGKLSAYHFNNSCADDELFYLTALLDDGFLPQRVMLPLLSVAFISPLEHFLRLAECEPKFITALVGKTGTRKSTTAAFFCSFFGKFTASSLPNSFHDTSNSILNSVYHTKDVLTCVDDLHPNGLFGDAEMRNTAQNLSRYYGDRTGRGRLNTKAEEQPGRPPMGMCLMTAERIPEITQSGLARYFIIEIGENDVKLDLLSEYQSLVSKGIINGMMRSYVEWLKEKYLKSAEDFVKKLSALFKFYRSDLIKFLSERHITFHSRTPDMLANLKIGFDFLLEFLCDKGQIGSSDAVNYKNVFNEILIENIRRSSVIIENENVSYQFCEKLLSLLDSGRCSLNMIGNDDDTNRKGFIGYEDSDHYYLIINAALSEINRLSKELGDGFSVGRNSLTQQLAEDGIIITKGKRNTTSVRVSPTTQKSLAILDKKRIENLLYGAVSPPAGAFVETDG